MDLYLPTEFEEAVLLGGVKQKGLRNDHTMGKDMSKLAG